MEQTQSSHTREAQHKPGASYPLDHKKRITISLTDFVDFASRSGTAQLTKVKELIRRGDYDPRADFWKPLRDCIQQHHQGRRTLESVLATLTDAKKARRYPQAITGYKKVLNKQGPIYFRVASWDWVCGELRVRVNPEVGFEIGEKKYAVKLHFKDERLTRHRLTLLFETMWTAMTPNSTLIPAVLDVSNARFSAAPASDGRLKPWLEAQAIAFIHMWNALLQDAQGKVN